jgi:hypothetical protein
MGTIYLGPFRNELRKKQDELVRQMMQGHLAQSIAITRKTIELMEADLAKGSSAFEYLFQPNPFATGAPAFRWAINTELHAEQLLIPYYRDSAGYDRQVARFKAYADQLRSNVDKAYVMLYDTSQVRQKWIVRRNLPTKVVIERIATALQDYLANHEADDDVLRITPQEGLWRMLEEDRFDLQLMLRLAVDQPLDIQVYTIERKQEDAGLIALAEIALSTVIYDIPVIGNAVAAFEVWRGKDIWGHELSDFDRSVLGATILLPAAFRLIKAGRSMYTTERLVRLYGEDAREWSKAVARAEKLSADTGGLRRLEQADELLASEKPIVRTAREKLADLFKALGLDSAGKAIKPVAIAEDELKAFERIIARHPKLAGLDAPAMERIIAKGTEINLVKAQILEELQEERIVSMLRDPYGRVALGLADVKGSLYYIPGHLIRDEFGLQLTDGMIVRFVKDRLQVVAVFEAKSGAASARGLAAKFTALTEKDKVELLAEAKESIKELEERARINNLPSPTVTVEEQMKRIKQTQLGGQIRSDVERLSELKVWINGRELPVDLAVGPRSTKWFGVLPSDVKSNAIKQAIIDAFSSTGAQKQGVKINVEMLGMDIKASELIDAAKSVIGEMSKLAAP